MTSSGLPPVRNDVRGRSVTHRSASSPMTAHRHVASELAVDVLEFAVATQRGGDVWPTDSARALMPSRENEAGEASEKGESHVP